MGFHLTLRISTVDRVLTTTIPAIDCILLHGVFRFAFSDSTVFSPDEKRGGSGTGFYRRLHHHGVGDHRGAIPGQGFWQLLPCLGQPDRRGADCPGARILSRRGAGGPLATTVAPRFSSWPGRGRVICDPGLRGAANRSHHSAPPCGPATPDFLAKI